MSAPLWIQRCWEAHEDRLVYGATALGDWSFDDAWRMCWCCGGSSRKLQKCHIVPRSLGGSDKPENIIPLCPMCHDEMPDVIDPEVLWSWIKHQQNELSTLGLGRFSKVIMDNFRLAEAAAKRGDLFDATAVMDNFHYLIHACTSLHGGQNGQGMYLKDATIRWAFSKALQQATTHGQLSLPTLIR